ncbi:MAG: hypothetical protein NZ772_16920 [Cyanobacteria bacterium]|nr:hypothetical protein [Cyanobacteriota bacterium]MDW8202834.1 hypothetical protein [Cyanobacteriota bacterium SKYGB_h_bin112]
MTSQSKVGLWHRGVYQVLLAAPLAAIGLGLWNAPSQAEVSIILQTDTVQTKYPSNYRNSYQHSYQRRYYRSPWIQRRVHRYYDTTNSTITYPTHQVITPVVQPVIIHSPESSGSVIVLPSSSSVHRVNSSTTTYPQVVYPQTVYPQVIYPHTTYPQRTIRRTTSVQIRF